MYNSTLTVRDKMKVVADKAAAGAFRPQDILPTKRTRLRDDPELQRNVRGYLEEHGIHGLTLKKVKDYVVARMPNLARMHLEEVSHVLRS